ncbi:hypothetical protein PsorP6_008585 [Peronosclerospora sorghi]|uniref:Uncharacterized protein n=1 Tax=Peronosclerospora sorghi TaxID=230839 RepID=A0ACC0WBJ5_9STRA|nr:hypothetical protein PsorP6_008585 [Peronosclerospora sorghi]
MFSGATLCMSFGTKVNNSIRALEPVLANKGEVQFIVGTSTFNQPNQIILVEINDDTSQVLTRNVFGHPGEVLSLAPSPQDSHLLVTCGKKPNHPTEAFLWHTETGTSTIEESGEVITAAAAKDLTLVAAFPDVKQRVSECTWNETTATSMLASSHETVLRSWQLDRGSVEAQDKLELDVSTLEDTTKRGAKSLIWDPHHASRLSFAFGGTLRTWDLRAKHDSISVVDAHLSTILSLDFNPNKPHAVATGGDDGKIKFWDLRHACNPLLTLNAHSHWVCSTRFHPQHDQLVLSGSSDATSALWRVSSISSSPLVELDERDLLDKSAVGAAVADTLIRRVQDHEDTVYAARWAAGGDSWMFASVSCDGRLAINYVPSTEKYKILL